MALTITKDNFKSEVLECEKPVLVDFWAPWCGPCKMVGPIIDALAEERTDLKIGKVNVDDEPDLAAQYAVQSIPTIILYAAGRVIKRVIGARPKEDLLKELEI
jgi:thioredoxin 1